MRRGYTIIEGFDGGRRVAVLGDETGGILPENGDLRVRMPELPRHPQTDVAEPARSVMERTSKARAYLAEH